MWTRVLGPGLTAVLVSMGVLGVPAAAQAQRFGGSGGGLYPYTSRPLGGLTGAYAYSGYGPYATYGYGPYTYGSGPYLARPGSSYSPYGFAYYNGLSLSSPYSYVPSTYKSTISSDQNNTDSPSNAQSNVPPMADAGTGVAAPVSVSVRVPANAEVWFNGSKTTQTGARREFRSPPVPPGDGYGYEIRARWQSPNGTVDQTRTVRVRAGQHVIVDFAAR